MNHKFSVVGFAFKLFKRHWARRSLFNLLLAVHLSMLSASVIYLVLDRLESVNDQQVAEVLGADLVITSPYSIADDWSKKAHALSLVTAKVTEFPSVLVSDGKLQLSSVKAISASYPLKGVILIEAPNQLKNIQEFKNSKGKIWLEPRLATLLAVELNSIIELGYAEFEFAGVIKEQPNQNSTLFNIAPTAIIFQQDLGATKILQPGSRVTHRYLYSGERNNIKNFQKWIKKRLDSSQRLVSLYDQSRALGSSIQKSKKYINLSSVLTILLLSVAIAMSATRYTDSQLDMSALMRCFGLNSNDVLMIFVWVLFYVAILGIISGGLLAYLIQIGLLYLFSDIFSADLVAANGAVMLVPAVTSFALLFGFSIPALLRLKNISPMRVLRRQLQPTSLSSWTIYLVAISTLAIILYLQIGDFKLILSVTLVVLLMLLLLLMVSMFILSQMRSWSRSNNAAINLSLRQLYADKGVTLIRLLAFSSSLFVMALIFIIKTELISKWQQSLDPDAPNHFMVNIATAQKPELEKYLLNKKVFSTESYPMVRGRLSTINGHAIREVLSPKALLHNSLRRELNITWTLHLPKGNKVQQGQWGWLSELHYPQISVDHKMAARLGIKIGDRLGFRIGGKLWDAEIVNIRSIDWQTLTPNFYIIAQPHSLDEFAATYIKAFHLLPAQKPLVTALTKQFPNAIIIELDRIFEQIKAIVSKAGQAIELIMIFIFAAGLVLLWASMEYTYSQKMKQSAILRTLGASRKFIAASLRFEFVWLSLISVFISICGIELATFWLYEGVFEVDYEPHFALWWQLPLFLFALILLSSWRGINRLTRPPPLSLLS